MPSGNGVAVEALQTLALLTGDPHLQEAADRALRATWPAIEGAPYAHVGLLEGLQNHLEPPEQLVIRGVDPELKHWRRRPAAAMRPARASLPFHWGNGSCRPDSRKKAAGTDKPWPTAAAVACVSPRSVIRVM